MHEELLQTPRFSVQRRRFDQAGSEPIVRDVVVHPGAVVILPLLSDKSGKEQDCIVMIRQMRYSVGETLWELPAGTREPNEPPIETARRELIEETGYEAGQIKPLAEFYTSPGITTELMHAFVASDLTHVGQRLEHGEQISVEPMLGEDVQGMLSSGEIRDGKTMAVLGLYFAKRD